jgi:hypothetical protein
MLTIEQVREIEREITAQFRQSDLTAAVSHMQSALPPASQAATSPHEHSAPDVSHTEKHRRGKRRSRQNPARASTRGPSPAMMDFLVRAYSNPHVRAAMHNLAEQ